VRRVAVVVLLLPMLLSGCGSDQDGYCDAVSSHQKELSETLGSGRSDALLQALDTFRDLADRAPSDITDEWQQLIRSIEDVRQAMGDAGVDPATYDRNNPPAGLSDEQKKAIDDAAARLGSGETLQALKDVDQQVRDVCHTPLTL
jgi:hypothetical protein